MKLDHPRTSSLVVIVVNALLTVIKGGVGLWAGSTALLADAVHSMADILSGAIVYIGVRIGEQPADEDHHFGHGNAEILAATLVSGMLMATGLFLAFEAGRVVYAGTVVPGNRWALLAAGSSVVINELLYRYTYWVGRRHNSPAVLAVAQDNRADALSSMAAVLGIGGAMWGHPYADPLAGMLIGVFIMRMGLSTFLDNVNVLMAGAPDAETIEGIRLAVLDAEGVLGLHSLRVHTVGPHVGVTVDIEVQDELTVKQGHDIADGVEMKVRREFASVRFMTVHVDPHDSDGHGAGTPLPLHGKPVSGGPETS
ncbi:cation transporter [bacterium AH-315-F18]|nr:cation transporter [bacterium AH-315-F18]